MAHQPDTDANPLPSTFTFHLATNMIMDSDPPFKMVNKGKWKAATTSLSQSLLSYDQRQKLPASHITVATAAGTNHPDAPPTKKRTSIASTTNQKENNNDSTLLSGWTRNFYSTFKLTKNCTCTQIMQTDIVGCNQTFGCHPWCLFHRGAKGWLAIFLVACCTVHAS